MNVSPMKNQAESKATRRADLVEEMKGVPSGSSFLLTVPGDGSSSGGLFADMSEENDKLLKQIHSVQKLLPKKQQEEEEEESDTKQLSRRSAHNGLPSKKEEKQEYKRSSSRRDMRDDLKRRSSHRQMGAKSSHKQELSPRRKERSAAPATDRLKGMRRCQTVDTKPTTEPPKSMRRCKTVEHGNAKQQPETLEESPCDKAPRNRRSRRSIHSPVADQDSPMRRSDHAAKRTGRKQGADVRSSQIHQALKLQELQHALVDDESGTIEEEEEEQKEEQKEPPMQASEKDQPEVEGKNLSNSQLQDLSDRSSTHGSTSPRRASSMLPSFPRISFGLGSGKKEEGRQSTFLNTMSSLVPQLPGSNYGLMEEEEDDFDVFPKEESSMAMDDSAVSKQEGDSSRNNHGAASLESESAQDHETKNKNEEEDTLCTSAQGRSREDLIRSRRQRNRRGNSRRNIADNKSKSISPRRQNGGKRQIKLANNQLVDDVCAQ
ncbi:expressed unknown protein [Seminavis robusta]|uniref:Uncharacterized protein n=1 Tax=Seminavis robusta TaxID=568900 RepID=A0A9N8EGH8_9STRA|nr:expressed unknown protein [Seminavis robusta]|eukprot:Sro959_g224740.1 n/a (490) ;mRNA; r:11857-13326